MLGYGDGTFTTRSYFGNPPNGDFGMDDVKCTGSEADIKDCPHVTNHNCGPGEAAGAYCSNYLGPNTGDTGDWGWREEDLVGGVREHIWVPFRVSFPRAPVFPFKVMLSKIFFQKPKSPNTTNLQ